MKNLIETLQENSFEIGAGLAVLAVMAWGMAMLTVLFMGGN